MLSRVSSHLHICLSIIFFYSIASPGLSVGSGWHFTALYVYDKCKQRKKSNWSEENQNLHSSLEGAVQPVPTQPASSSPQRSSLRPSHTPYVVTELQFLSQSRASPTLLVVTRHLDGCAINTCKADLPHMGAEMSSVSSALTLRTKISQQQDQKIVEAPQKLPPITWFLYFPQEIRM